MKFVLYQGLDTRYNLSLLLFYQTLDTAYRLELVSLLVFIKPLSLIQDISSAPVLGYKI